MNETLNSVNRLVASDSYTQFWKMLLDSCLTGLIARVLTLVLLATAVWFVVRRENFPLGLTFLALAAFVMYGHPILIWIGFIS